MKKIPNITNQRYEIATGHTKCMGMRNTVLAHLGYIWAVIHGLRKWPGDPFQS